MDLELIFNTILNNFNFGLIIAINVFTYGVIKVIDTFKVKSVNKLIKVFITIFSCLLFGFIYYKYGNIEPIIILNSCISAPLIWDWVLKPILRKIKIDYENE